MKFHNFFSFFLFMFMVTRLSGQNNSFYNVNISNITCYGANNGSIKISNIKAPSSSYSLFILDSAKHIKKEHISETGSIFELNNLSPGKFYLQLLTQTKRSEIIDSFIIQTPLVLKMNKISLEAIDNPDQGLYTLKANPSGGTPVYQYLWSKNAGNSTEPKISNVPKGTYTCTISDSNHCGPVTATFFLIDQEIEKFQKNKTKVN